MEYKGINVKCEEIHNYINNIDNIDNNSNEILWDIAETFKDWNKIYNGEKIKPEKLEIKFNNNSSISFNDYKEMKEKGLLESHCSRETENNSEIDEYFPFVSAELGLINLITLIGKKHSNNIDYYYEYNDENDENEENKEFKDTNTKNFNSEFLNKLDKNKPSFVIYNEGKNSHAVFNIIMNNKVFNFDLRKTLQIDDSSCRSIALKLLKYYSNLYKEYKYDKNKFYNQIQKDEEELNIWRGNRYISLVPEHLFEILQSVSKQDIIINSYNEVLKLEKKETKKEDIKNSISELEYKIKIANFFIEKEKNKLSSVEQDIEEVEEAYKSDVNKKEIEDYMAGLDQEINKYIENYKKYENLTIEGLEKKEDSFFNQSFNDNEHKKNENFCETFKKLLSIKIESQEKEREKFLFEKLSKEEFLNLYENTDNLQKKIEELNGYINRLRGIQRQYVKDLQLRKSKKVDEGKAKIKKRNISSLTERLEHLLILREMVKQKAILNTDIFEKLEYKGKNNLFNIINFSETFKNFDEKIKNEQIDDSVLDYCEHIYKVQGEEGFKNLLQGIKKENLNNLIEQDKYKDLTGVLERFFLIEEELDNLSSEIKEGREFKKK